MLRVTLHSVLFFVPAHSARILSRNMVATLFLNRKASNTFTCLLFSGNAVTDTGTVLLAEHLTAPLSVSGVHAESTVQTSFCQQ